ncbi:uncharacterized protein OCT59_002114 [Rhizophagus irregularis]|uniref:uncharacterized protein n=1 Tax=Rhizophagus irregularis TaxID=588596 RepID=UPI00332F4407|nr:hypothetical protein OCT59_002114 [Rhizophagus irregularis]
MGYTLRTSVLCSCLPAAAPYETESKTFLAKCLVLKNLVVSNIVNHEHLLIPILQPIFLELTYDSNPTEFNLQQSDDDDVNDDFIDESIPVDSDDSIYREKQTRLNKSWQSIRVQLKEVLIELESHFDCIYFEHEIKKQLNLCNCEQSNFAVALARREIFPASPINPLIAFEIKLLEFAE